MTSNTGSVLEAARDGWTSAGAPGTATGVGAPPAAGDDALAVTAEDELAVLLDTVAHIERLHATAVALAGRVADAGTAERAYGLPVDTLLAWKARMPGGDRHTLITAGQVLATMPRLAAAHRAARVSWGQVRHIVGLVKRRSLDDRAVIDARVAATLDADGQGAHDPDGLCDAVDAAVDQLVSRRAVEARDTRAVAANRLWAQLGLDGRVTGGFAYDAASAAVVLNALAAQQGRPAAGDPDRPPQVPTAQQRSTAQALVDLCHQRLTGDPAPDNGAPDSVPGGSGGGRARPAYVVSVDAGALDASQPGRLRLRLPGAPPRLSGRRVAADAAAGADVRVVLTHGAAPLAVSGVARTDAAVLDHQTGRAHARTLGIPRSQQGGIGALIAAVNHALTRSSDIARAAGGHRPLCDPTCLDADDVLTATRVAVANRDNGCRFIGCTAPADWTDIHHTVHREHGGDHHPDRLVQLCRLHHTLVHDYGWTLTVDPATATVTGRRGPHTWTTLPRASPLVCGPRPRPPPRPSQPPGPPGATPGRPASRTPTELPF